MPSAKESRSQLSRLLTVKEVAALLGVSRSCVYKLTWKDQIPRLYINGGALRFDFHQIESWLKTQPVRRKKKGSRKEEVA